MLHHLTLHGRPYCDFIGCMAGLTLADKAGVHTCSQPSGAAAQRAARALRMAGATCVAVVAGDCPTAATDFPTGSYDPDDVGPGREAGEFFL